MYQAVNGIYDNGKITLTEKAPIKGKTKVVVMFMEENENEPKKKVGVRIGRYAHLGYKLPDDFNEPLQFV